MKECSADEKNLDIIRGLGYTIKAVMKFIVGPVAQLGERSVRIREVESSNLFRSTKNRLANASLFFYAVTWMATSSFSIPPHCVSNVLKSSTTH